jgi:methylated-DNA-[protein]-cysteine S-methyltransferase
LRLLGTPFQRQVWTALAEVPFGRTLTYARLAAAAGRAGAVRAAAGAVAANPLSVLVPCHRVVPAAGGTGNYGSGPQRKRALLALEGALTGIEGRPGPESENPAGN